jgi:hypothetical protein
MSAQKARPPVLTWLYNNNPFYALSAVLMLFAVRSAYGELRIGYINCWIMMGVLAVYTAVLATIAVLIVRRGKVWEDARSILLLLLVLFLAVSVSADDLFVKSESPAGSALLLLCGYVFSALVTEIVLRGAQIRLGTAYRLPLHSLLALFYVAPWWCSRHLPPGSLTTLQWSVFLFPVAAAALLLTLLPAIRRGPSYVYNNGTPWTWPLFPWTAFGMIIAAVALRTFALCMTFGPEGPIWNYGPNGGRSISFDTMWGPYFLVPPALAVLTLLLEAGLVTKNERLVRRVLFATPLLLLLAIPVSNGPVFRGFLATFTATLGSPIWLAAWLQLAFFVWARCRRVSGSGNAALATLTLLSLIGPHTLSLRTLTNPQPLPLLAVGLVLSVAAVRERSSWLGTLSAMVLTFAVWLVLPETALPGFRVTVCYHLLWATVIVLGLACHDRFASALRLIGALQMPIASLIAMLAPAAARVPFEWRMAYVLLLTIACITIARTWRSRWYLYAFTAQLAIGGYGVTVLGFRGGVSLLGRAAMTSFAWSLAALLIGVLISAHKADWLPARLFPRWNGHVNGATPPGLDKRE